MWLSRVVPQPVGNIRMVYDSCITPMHCTWTNVPWLTSYIMMKLTVDVIKEIDYSAQLCSGTIVTWSRLLWWSCNVIWNSETWTANKWITMEVELEYSWSCWQNRYDWRTTKCLINQSSAIFDLLMIEKSHN